MNHVKLRLRIDAIKLRSLCINREWFTLGDCKQYSILFKQAGEFNDATDIHVQEMILEDMAWLICQYSDLTSYDFYTNTEELQHISYHLGSIVELVTYWK